MASTKQGRALPPSSIAIINGRNLSEEVTVHVGCRTVDDNRLQRLYVRDEEKPAHAWTQSFGAFLLPVILNQTVKHHRGE